MFVGLTLVVIGALFLLQNLGVLPSSAWNVVWPLIVIVLGLSMLAKKRKCHLPWCHCKSCGEEEDVIINIKE